MEATFVESAPEAEIIALFQPAIRVTVIQRLVTSMFTRSSKTLLHARKFPRHDVRNLVRCALGPVGSGYDFFLQGRLLSDLDDFAGQEITIEARPSFRAQLRTVQERHRARDERRREMLQHQEQLKQLEERKLERFRQEVVRLLSSGNWGCTFEQGFISVPSGEQRSISSLAWCEVDKEFGSDEQQSLPRDSYRCRLGWGRTSIGGRLRELWREQRRQERVEAAVQRRMHLQSEVRDILRRLHSKLKYELCGKREALSATRRLYRLQMASDSQASSKRHLASRHREGMLRSR